MTAPNIVLWVYIVLLVAEVVLGILLAYMGMKFAKSKKFMPSGLMAILSSVALALRFFLK